MIHVYHHNDNDGRCAAAIVGMCNRDSDVLYREMDYKDVPDFSYVKPEDEVYIVDFSFKPEVMDKLRAFTSHVHWCDHHVTAKEYGYDDIPGVRDFSEKGLSGCECTWKYLMKGEAIPLALQLLGDYDAWRLEHRPDCFLFYEGLKLNDTRPVTGFWGRVDDKMVGTILSAGKTAMQYRDNYCTGLRNTFGYETELDGYRAYALNAYMLGSGAYADKFKEFQLCIAYIHDGAKFTVSLYSENVDVSEIAKKHGGGGHKGAAGFVCNEIPWRRK